MNIGENIRKFREEKRMSQRHLGNLANISGQYISLLEKSDSKLLKSLDTIEAIAQALDVTVPELLGYVTPTLEFTKPDISEFTTEELLKEIVRRIS